MPRLFVVVLVAAAALSVFLLPGWQIQSNFRVWSSRLSPIGGQQKAKSK